MSPVCIGLLGAGLYAKPTLLLRREVSSFEPSVAWNRMSKSWSEVLTVAEIEPDLRVTAESVCVIFVSLDSGLPAGYRSKCGVGLRAPNQCVVSTDITPSNGARMSWDD
jgi:hypothetical protein